MIKVPAHGDASLMRSLLSTAKVKIKTVLKSQVKVLEPFMARALGRSEYMLIELIMAT